MSLLNDIVSHIATDLSSPNSIESQNPSFPKISTALVALVPKSSVKSQSPTREAFSQGNIPTVNVAPGTYLQGASIQMGRGSLL